MSKTFKKDNLFKNFNSATKESLSDIGENFEEIDKIENEALKSVKPKKLSVDYSKFENHIFYGSAFWAINFILARIFDDENGYPWDGELKDKNAWKNDNTDFENWFFENEWPHQNGFLNLTGTTHGTFIDYERDFKLESGSSLTVEFNINAHHQQTFNSSSTVGATILHYGDTTSGGYSVAFDTSHTALKFTLLSASVSETLNLTFTGSLSQSTHVAFVYDSGSQKQIAYVNSEIRASRSISSNISFINPGNNPHNGTLYLGVYDTGSAGGLTGSFSGSLDDLRIWKSARTHTEIKKNYFKSIHANSSASLVGYYKFNELFEMSPTNLVVDYSGNENHILLYGNNISLSKISGSVSSFFKSKGDPIFNRANTRVSSSLSTWFTSGSFYDKENRNYIFQLIPSQFIDEPGNDELQLFLLLLARHWDRLRIYIEHLAYVLYSDESGYNVSPDECLNLLALTYGIDIADLYEAKDALQYYFGENVLSSGSLDNSLQEIRGQLRRNLVNNLHYIIKTKSTRESILASLRSLGIDDTIININEYSIFSGGLKTSYNPKTVERRVLKLNSFDTGSFVNFHSSAWGQNNDVSIELRFLANSASLNTSMSLWSIKSGSELIGEMTAERENLTSSNGYIKFYWQGLGISSGNPITSSLQRIFDNDWVNVVLFKPSATDSLLSGNLYTSRLFRDELDFSQSIAFSFGSVSDIDPTQFAFTGSIGTGSNGFNGYLQEFRAWSVAISSSNLLDRHGKDFDSIAVPDFKNDINDLKIHFKLNDFTSSVGNVEIHNYANSLISGTLVGASTSSLENFPGKYIYKLDPSYGYDLGIDNDKIRIISGSKFTNSNINEDIPYISLDLSPVSSLNKEIIKSFGDLEKFNNIIGQPYHKYEFYNTELGSHKYKFFETKINQKTSYRNFLNILKWLDMNFGSYFEQLIPLDLGSSVSNFVIEPHIFEQNSFVYPFPFSKNNRSKDLETTISNITSFTASTADDSFDLADPGRFGAAVSSSSEISQDIYFVEYTGSGVNYRNRLERKVWNEILSGNVGNLAISGYGNGFYNISITGSNHLKNVLNVIENTTIRNITGSLEAIEGPTVVDFTGTINAALDQLWLYQHPLSGSSGTELDRGSSIDSGIAYGGGYGQLWYIANKSNKGSFVDKSGTRVSRSIDINLAPNDDPIEIKRETENDKTLFLPENKYKDGFVAAFTQGQGGGNGRILKPLYSTNLFVNAAGAAPGILPEFYSEEINIKNYKSANIVINNEVQFTRGDDMDLQILKYRLKFQFYDDLQPGRGEFEKIFSSSISADSTNFISKDLVVIFDKTFNSVENVGTNFIFQYSRNLPSSKKMKVYLKLETTPVNLDQIIHIKSTPIITLFREEMLEQRIKDE